jgi:hypothetical protein
MTWSRPAAARVWEAVEAYVRVAYAGGKAPSAVMHRLETLHATPGESFFDSPVFERDDPKSPTRFGLRLGNRAYPHMKLVIERSPDGKSHLFRADTHDRHIRPAPSSREYKAFCDLMQTNQSLAEQVEAEWCRCGLATFKQYLRRDLERRSHDGGPGHLAETS